MNEVSIIEEIMASMGCYEELHPIMYTIRRPNISALCLEAVTSGSAPTVLDMVRRGMPPLDPNAFAWPGYAQSLMDLAGSGPYSWTGRNGDMLQRADAW